MPLPILQRNALATPEDLLRFHLRTALHWARHYSQEEALDFGTALYNAQLASVANANQIFDVALPAGISPADAVAQVQECYAKWGTRCRKWIMSPAALPHQNQPLIAHLLASGHVRESSDVLYLNRMPPPLADGGMMKIIPTRASYRHARQLAIELTAPPDEPQAATAKAEAVEGEMLHLDDPHVDSLLALIDGTVVAQVSVLAVGDIGAIAELFVARAFRRKGIGRTMLGRALEICTRSLFKHVFVAIEAGNEPANALFHGTGFGKVGEFVRYTDHGA